MQHYDMLCMEERTYAPHTFLERLFEADRALLHKNAVQYLDPINGVMSPRFYRRDVLEKGLSNIPEAFIPEILAWEEAIIYHESLKTQTRSASYVTVYGTMSPMILSCSSKRTSDMVKAFVG